MTKQTLLGERCYCWLERCYFDFKNVVFDFKNAIVIADFRDEIVDLKDVIVVLCYRRLYTLLLIQMLTLILVTFINFNYHRVYSDISEIAVKCHF